MESKQENTNNQELAHLILQMTVQISSLFDLLIEKKIVTKEEVEEKLKQKSLTLMREVDSLNKHQGMDESEVLTAAGL